MSLRSLGSVALLTGIAVGVAWLPASPARADAQQNHVSQEIARPLIAAQKDLAAGRAANTAGQKAQAQQKFQDALTQLQKAEGYSRKTPFDEHVINQMSGSAYLGLGDQANAAKYFELAVNDGFMSPAQTHTIINALSQMYYNLKDYDKSIKYATEALNGGFGDAQTPRVIVGAYYLKGDWQGTQKFESSYAASEVQKGQTPPVVPLELWLNACVKLNDTQCQMAALQDLVTYHPTPEYWADLLGEVAQTPSIDDKGRLQLYRLMLDVNAMKTPGQYTQMAQFALEQGSPGEAESILQKGLADNVFSQPGEQSDARALLAQARRVATGDRASLPTLDRQADQAATGKLAYAAGYAYYGYGEYEKAIADLSKGLAKGGLADDEPAAQLLLGIAQLKAGHKDAAIQSFQAVKGDPLLEKIASLWALHAKQPPLAS